MELGRGLETCAWSTPFLPDHYENKSSLAASVVLRFEIGDETSSQRYFLWYFLPCPYARERMMNPYGTDRSFVTSSLGIS